MTRNPDLISVKWDLGTDMIYNDLQAFQVIPMCPRPGSVERHRSRLLRQRPAQEGLTDRPPKDAHIHSRCQALLCFCSGKGNCLYFSRTGGKKRENISSLVQSLLLRPQSWLSYEFAFCTLELDCPLGVPEETKLYFVPLTVAAGPSPTPELLAT